MLPGFLEGPGCSGGRRRSAVSLSSFSFAAPTGASFWATGKGGGASESPPQAPGARWWLGGKGRNGDFSALATSLPGETRSASSPPLFPVLLPPFLCPHGILSSPFPSPGLSLHTCIATILVCHPRKVVAEEAPRFLGGWL